MVTVIERLPEFIVETTRNQSPPAAPPPIVITGDILVGSEFEVIRRIDGLRSRSTVKEMDNNILFLKK